MSGSDSLIIPLLRERNERSDSKYPDGDARVAQVVKRLIDQPNHSIQYAAVSSALHPWIPPDRIERIIKNQVDFVFDQNHQAALKGFSPPYDEEDAAGMANATAMLPSFETISSKINESLASLHDLSKDDCVVAPAHQESLNSLLTKAKKARSPRSSGDAYEYVHAVIRLLPHIHQSMSDREFAKVLNTLFAPVSSKSKKMFSRMTSGFQLPIRQ